MQAQRKVYRPASFHTHVMRRDPVTGKATVRELRTADAGYESPEQAWQR